MFCTIFRKLSYAVFHLEKWKNESYYIDTKR